MAPLHGLTRARPHTRIGTQEETAYVKHWHHLHPVCQRRNNEYANQQCKEAGSYSKQATGHFKQTWTKSCHFQTSSRRLSDQTLSSSQLLHSAFSLWNWQYLWRKGARAHMNWKKAKYTDLQTLCKERRWQTWLFPVEVGCRGFPAQSVWTTLSSLDIVGRQCRATVKRSDTLQKEHPVGYGWKETSKHSLIMSGSTKVSCVYVRLFWYYK